MRGGNHINDFFFIIDPIKKPPGADSISPCFRIKALQFFDMEPKMRMATQLRMYEIDKLLSDLVPAGECDLLQVFLELFGFEYAIAIQQSGLCVLRRPLNPALV